MAKSKFDVYDHVTDQIITQIAGGTPPWRRPWTGGSIGAAMPLRWNGEAYRGINVVMLWAVAAEHGYVSNRWLTYRQAQDLGGQVTKGQKSATVVKYGTFDGEKESSSLNDPMSAATDAKKIGYCRAYRVFNADQIEGLDKAFYVKPEPPRDLGTKADAGLDAFFAATGAKMETSTEPRAYYDIARDRIHMPPIETFHEAARYYGVQGHELVHWTGAIKRLDRLRRFADRKAYAFEELVAEIGTCMLGAHIGVEPDFGQSAAYVEGWQAALKEDSRAIFRAASEAQKAVDYILTLAEIPLGKAA
ncbi:zincin-like metallopeptidase domain-containing protein [uncultured Sulfitobacter sp.]|jgi:antirestriction protein ArdC|uniref:ArdC family protein n=1 Tax=uncultured Sulfitobacter sp. TaxID=191468 RepID=UPI0030F70E59